MIIQFNLGDEFLITNNFYTITERFSENSCNLRKNTHRILLKILLSNIKTNGIHLSNRLCLKVSFFYHPLWSSHSYLKKYFMEFIAQKASWILPKKIIGECGVGVVCETKAIIFNGVFSAYLYVLCVIFVGCDIFDLYVPKCDAIKSIKMLFRRSVFFSQEGWS